MIDSWSYFWVFLWKMLSFPKKNHLMIFDGTFQNFFWKVMIGIGLKTVYTKQVRSECQQKVHLQKHHMWVLEFPQLKNSYHMFIETNIKRIWLKFKLAKLLAFVKGMYEFLHFLNLVFTLKIGWVSPSLSYHGPKLWYFFQIRLTYLRVNQTEHTV